MNARQRRQLLNLKSQRQVKGEASVTMVFDLLILMMELLAYHDGEKR